MHGTIFGTTHIGSRLHEEHQSTLRCLNDLELLIRFREAPDLRDANTRRRLEDVARTLEDDVTRHFAFEEEELFPRLRQAGAGFMVDMLTAEHADIRPFAQDLSGLVRGVLEAGFTADTWSEFVRLANELLDRETFHIQKEEMGLLSALAQILDSETDALLAERHAKRADGATR